MTQDGQYDYTYDAENRLIAVVPKVPADGDMKVESTYDYMGRRVRKIVTAWDATLLSGAGDWKTTAETDHRFVYDGWNPVLRMDDTNTINQKYTWGLDLSGLSGNITASGLHGAGGIGGLLATQGVNGIYTVDQAYFYDGNGNVGQTFNQNMESTSGKYEYDPYGNLTSVAGLFGNNRNPFRFSTKYFDSELNLHTPNDGLYYYGHRYYSPRLGRWVTRDPIGEEGGDNIYSFVANSSTTHVDFLGLAAETASSCACKVGNVRLPKCETKVLHFGSDPDTEERKRNLIEAIGGLETATQLADMITSLRAAGKTTAEIAEAVSRWLTQQSIGGVSSGVVDAEELGWRVAHATEEGLGNRTGWHLFIRITYKQCDKDAVGWWPFKSPGWVSHSTPWQRYKGSTPGFGTWYGGGRFGSFRSALSKVEDVCDEMMDRFQDAFSDVWD